jgi:hypothetical protein
MVSVVLGVEEVVLAVNDDLLAVLEQLINDDGLVCHCAGWYGLRRGP